MYCVVLLAFFSIFDIPMRVDCNPFPPYHVVQFFGSIIEEMDIFLKARRHLYSTIFAALVWMPCSTKSCHAEVPRSIPQVWNDQVVGILRSEDFAQNDKFKVAFCPLRKSANIVILATGTI